VFGKCESRIMKNELESKKISKSPASTPLVLNVRMMRLLDRVEKDIKKGKNAVGPFETTEEAQKYLDSLK